LTRASHNIPKPDVVDNIKERVDLELMLCMASKESVKRMMSVEEVMKVRDCQSVIALNQLHMYAVNSSKGLSQVGPSLSKIIFADLIHSFFHDNALLDGIVKVKDYIAGKLGDTKKDR
jgi:hypothetical protein